MPRLKSTVSLLCGTILLAFSTVGAHIKYYSYSASELSMRSNLQVDGDRHDVSSVQAGQTCPLSGACEVCHTAQIGSDGYFHVCPDDGKYLAIDTYTYYGRHKDLSHRARCRRPTHYLTANDPPYLAINFY